MVRKELSDHIDKIEKVTNSNIEQLGRLDTRAKNIENDLDRIGRKIDRLLERSHVHEVQDKTDSGDTAYPISSR